MAAQPIVVNIDGTGVNTGQFSKEEARKALANPLFGFTAEQIETALAVDAPETNEEFLAQEAANQALRDAEARNQAAEELARRRAATREVSGQDPIALFARAGLPITPERREIARAAEERSREAEETTGRRRQAEASERLRLARGATPAGLPGAALEAAIRQLLPPEVAPEFPRAELLTEEPVALEQRETISDAAANLIAQLSEVGFTAPQNITFGEEAPITSILPTPPTIGALGALEQQSLSLLQQLTSLLGGNLAQIAGDVTPATRPVVQVPINPSGRTAPRGVSFETSRASRR